MNFVYKAGVENYVSLASSIWAIENKSCAIRPSNAVRPTLANREMLSALAVLIVWVIHVFGLQKKSRAVVIFVVTGDGTLCEVISKVE